MGRNLRIGAAASAIITVSVGVFYVNFGTPKDNVEELRRQVHYLHDRKSIETYLNEKNMQWIWHAGMTYNGKLVTGNIRPSQIKGFISLRLSQSPTLTRGERRFVVYIVFSKNGEVIDFTVEPLEVSGPIL